MSMAAGVIGRVGVLLGSNGGCRMTEVCAGKRGEVLAVSWTVGLGYVRLSLYCGGMAIDSPTRSVGETLAAIVSRRAGGGSDGVGERGRGWVWIVRSMRGVDGRMWFGCCGAIRAGCGLGGWASAL